MHIQPDSAEADVVRHAVETARQKLSTADSIDSLLSSEVSETWGDVYKGHANKVQGCARVCACVPV